MESQSSRVNERSTTTGVGEHMLATPFSCRPCRLRKMKCDRVQPRCGRCIRLGDTCEYPKERRANVGRQKRVLELETKVGQLILSHKLILTCPNKCLIILPSTGTFACTRRANICITDQLEKLARAGKSGTAAEGDHIQESLQQESDSFFFTNKFHTTQSSDGSHSHDQPQLDTSFTGLVSAGMFEQQPPIELALYLYDVFTRYHSLELTEM